VWLAQGVGKALGRQVATMFDGGAGGSVAAAKNIVTAEDLARSWAPMMKKQ